MDQHRSTMKSVGLTHEHDLVGLTHACQIILLPYLPWVVSGCIKVIYMDMQAGLRAQSWHRHGVNLAGTGTHGQGSRGA